MSIKVIQVVIVGDKSWWWWCIEGPLVVDIVMLRQRGGGQRGGGGTKKVIISVCSIDEIILRRTGGNQTAGCHEGSPIVGLSIDLILKWPNWSWWWVVTIETAGADKAGEGQGVEWLSLLGLEEGKAAVDISVGAEGGEVDVSWRIYHY